MARLSDIPALAGVVTWQIRAPELVFEQISPSAERVFGYPIARWKEPGFWESIVHPEDRAEVVAFCTERTGSRADHVFDYRMIAADGRALVMRDVVSVREHPGGGMVLVGAFVDITDAFAERTDPDAHCLLPAGQPSMVSELPSVTEIETRLGGDPVLTRLPQAAHADIVAIALAARREAARIAAVPESKIRLRIHPDLDGMMRIDAEHLHCVLQLLIHSALLSRSAESSVEIEPDGGGLRIRLLSHRDESSGTPPPAPAARIREQALSVARIAWMVSRLGGHTVIEARSGQLRAEELRIPVNAAIGYTGPEREAKRRLLRVLYAEDNVTSAQVMSALLGLQGVHTDIAINGADAIALWEEAAPDLVLMDLRMPVLDGMEATRRIRRREEQIARRHTPIVGISAHLDDTVREGCLSAGMDDVLSKPVRIEQLRRLAEQFGSGRWPHI